MPEAISEAGERRRVPAPYVLLCLSVIAIAVAAAPSARAAEAEQKELHDKLTLAAESVIVTLDAGHSDERQLTLAVVPFVDADTGLTRKLGVRAPQFLERHVMASKPRWLSVQSRILLGSVLDEHKLWILDIVKEEKGKKTPHAFVEKADLLLVGSTAYTKKSVHLEWRLVQTRSANTLAAGGIDLEMRPYLHDLRTFIDACKDQKKKGISDDLIANVSRIDVRIIAQRAAPLEGLLRQWNVAPKGVLHNGDQLRIAFMPDADADIYIFLYGSDKKAVKLFPTDDWEEKWARLHGEKVAPKSPYCRAEWKYDSPGPDADGDRRFWKLDETPGRNVLYVCASRKPLRDARDANDVRIRVGDAPNDAQRNIILDQVFDHVEIFEFSQIRPTKEVRP